MESRLRAGELSPLAGLLDALGLSEHFTGDAVLCGCDPVIFSPHRLGEASATALLLIGAAGAAIWQHRAGVSTDVSTGIIQALHYLHPTHFVRQGRFRRNVGAEYVPTNGILPTRDNRYVMIEAGPPYPKLLSGYLNFFDCGNNRQSLAREIAKWGRVGDLFQPGIAEAESIGALRVRPAGVAVRRLAAPQWSHKTGTRRNL